MSSYPPAAESGGRARVLVAEDDGPSGRFFELALENIGCAVDVASRGHHVLQQARSSRYDLLLLDRHLPDFGAEDILARLRADASAASRGAPALVTSAEMDALLRQRLRAAGFADVVAKPVSLPALRAAIAPWVRTRARVAEEVLVPPRATDTANTVGVLRGLFLEELRLLRHDLEDGVQPTVLDARLHRLLASCSLCGANALGEATRALKDRLQPRMPLPAAHLRAFRAVLSQTIEALETRA